MKLIAVLISMFLWSCIESTKPNAPKIETGKTEEAPQNKSPALIGGRPADPADWPASVYARMNGSACSATVVGENTLLIASHCVEHGARAEFSIGATNYSSKCSRSPLYRRGVDHDLALCKTDKNVQGIKYENVNQDPSLVKVGTEVLLTGYGCIRAGGGGGNDGVYRIGEAKIMGLPSGNDYDYYAKGGAALCYGDSGGSAYLYLDSAKTKRIVVSTNSKGDIRVKSWITSTSTEASISFIKAWAEENQTLICGVHSEAKGCRGAEEQPLPSPTPACPQPKESTNG